MSVAHGAVHRERVTHFPGRLRRIPNTTPGWLFEISFGNRGRREILILCDFCDRKGEWGVPSIVFVMGVNFCESRHRPDLVSMARTGGDPRCCGKDEEDGGSQLPVACQG